MTPRVEVSEHAAKKIAAACGPERSPTGHPSEWDFWSGPLAAALIAFTDFDNLQFDAHPDIRTLHLVDPVFGAVVFIGIKASDDQGVIEIADFEVDPDYRNTIANDPTD